MRKPQTCKRAPIVKHEDHPRLPPSHSVCDPTNTVSSPQLAIHGKRTTNTVFFLHIPFPTSQIFRELECGEQLLDGMLNADVVGFHAFDHARHFLNACKRIVGLSYESRPGGLIGMQKGDRTVMVTMSHVSVEPSVLRTCMVDPITCGIRDELKRKHGDRQIVAGIDVAQKLAGLPLKFLAYERLLTDFPSWQKKVVLVQRCFCPGTRVGDESNTISEIR